MQLSLLARLTVAVGVLLLAWVGVSRSAALVIEQAPDQALALAPEDARALARRADAMAGVNATAADRRRADTIAQRALRRDPTVVSAATTLGLDAEILGRPRDAGAWRRYAQRLSRRDLRLQLWSIETAVAAGDYRDALHHYDETLRTQNVAPDLLFPILDNAIADSVIRRALVELIVRRPPWARDYVIRLAGEPAHVDAAAALIPELAAAGYRLPPAAPLLTTTLVGVGRPAQAWRFYRAPHRTTARAELRNGSFGPPPPFPTPFDWQLVNTQDVSTDLAATGTASGLAFMVGPTAGGLLARQAQLLPAGRYRLAGTATLAGATLATAPYWRLICFDGRELGRAPLAVADDARGFAATFAVPAGCPAQWLEFTAPPTDDQQQLSGSVAMVALASVR